MWWWTKKTKVGVAAAAALCAMALPVSDGQVVVFPPQVITADTAYFKVKPEDGLSTYLAQPAVYCGVTVC